MVAELRIMKNFRVNVLSEMKFPARWSNFYPKRAINKKVSFEKPKISVGWNNQQFGVGRQDANRMPTRMPRCFGVGPLDANRMPTRMPRWKLVGRFGCQPGCQPKHLSLGWDRFECQQIGCQMSLGCQIRTNVVPTVSLLTFPRPFIDIRFSYNNVACCSQGTAPMAA